MEQIKIYAGIAGGIFSLAAYVPYIISVVKGPTRPVRASWIIWTLSTLIILLSSYSIGVRNTIWVPLAYTLGCTAVLALSVRYGIKGWSRFDIWCLIVVIASIIAWFYFDSPLIALILNVTIDFVGYLPTIRKMLVDRNEQEDVTAWSLHVLGGTANLVAVASWASAEIAYPVVILVSSIATCVLAIRNRV
jgi:hypothetical protein